MCFRKGFLLINDLYRNSVLRLLGLQLLYRHGVDVGSGHELKKKKKISTLTRTPNPLAQPKTANQLWKGEWISPHIYHTARYEPESEPESLFDSQKNTYSFHFILLLCKTKKRTEYLSISCFKYQHQRAFIKLSCSNYLTLLRSPIWSLRIRIRIPDQRTRCFYDNKPYDTT